MFGSKLVIFTCIALLMGCTTAQEKPDMAQLQQQVADTERAFARTMADRDHRAFAVFLSDEAVFFSGETPHRGKKQTADGSKPYFEEPSAPL